MEEKIKKLYKKIELGINKNCKTCKCKNNLFKPNGMWHCGENAENGIMFVGKTAVTNKNENWESMNFRNTFEKLYKPNYSAFWHYIKAIAQNIYGVEKEWENISIVNLIKCNKGKTDDCSTNTMIENCCSKNKFLLKEIEYIKPNHIVFMLGNNYKDVINKMLLEKNFETIIYKDYPINNKVVMPVWYFKIIIDKEINCLLIGHPQGKNKEKYVDLVTKFIVNESEFLNMLSK